MADDNDKPEVEHEEQSYDSLPTSQLDLQARMKNDHKPTPVDKTSEVHDPAKVYAPYATEDTDTTDYIGVSPEYMTHASDTEKPHGFAGAEAESVKQTLQSGLAFSEEVPVKGKHTLGTGSSTESILSATSGEGVQSKKLDREAEQKKAEKAGDAEAPKAPAKATAPAPAKAPARPAQ